MTDSRMNENEMMETSQMIEEKIENVDGSQIINVLRNISEFEMTELGYKFE